MKNTPPTVNFRKCTSQTNFTACPIIPLGAASNHSISHALDPCSISLSLFSSPATSLLHFLPTVFKLLPVFDHLWPFSSLSSLSWNDPNYVPCSLHLNRWFSNCLCPVLLPTPFLVFFSILQGFVIVTLLTVELVIARPPQPLS